AIAELEALLAIDIGDNDIIDAIDYLHMSLGDDRGRELGSEVVWLDDTHIDEVKGEDVFQYEQEAADKLIAYLENDENTAYGFEDEIFAIIEKMYNADRILAEVAIQEAEAVGGDPDDIAAAKELLVEAIDYWDTGDMDLIVDYAFDKLEEAWEKAVGSWEWNPGINSIF
ncbi:MAG: hypothetical protein KAI64_06865, partial [Thermoplasmata archaeon]|nr:hypothetical protein [Thermoplasmata archaeon]